MKKIEEYYQKTGTEIPHANIKRFIEEAEIIPGKAIELGCGTGRDTIYLIRNKWNVIAIDKEDVEEKIRKKLKEEEQKQFKFEQQEFEQIKLEQNNLVVANFSLPFCNKNEFKNLWKKIEHSILKNRVLCR